MKACKLAEILALHISYKCSLLILHHPLSFFEVHTMAGLFSAVVSRSFRPFLLIFSVVMCICSCLAGIFFMQLRS